VKFLSVIKSVPTWLDVAGRTSAFGSIAIIDPTKEGKWGRWATRSYYRSLCQKYGIDVELVNGESLVDTPQAVTISNHQSLVDVVAIGAVFDRHLQFLTRDTLFRFPVFGRAMRKVGMLPVKFAKGRVNGHLEEAIHSAISSGAQLFYFPEGTRSKDGSLGRFKRGAFSAAVQENLPILPLVVQGSRELMYKGALRIRSSAKTKVRVRVLPPQWPQSTGDVEDRMVELRDRCRTLIAEALDDS
jgi:1-acyl-sn-glycerol-3-phosphate acyltransferase